MARKDLRRAHRHRKSSHIKGSLDTAKMLSRIDFAARQAKKSARRRTLLENREREQNASVESD